jgi:hypothetical protein
MKPLLHKDIPTFLERFCHFQDGEIVQLSILSPSELQLTLATQDKARDFDWVHVVFTFFGIENARLLENTQLQLVDMSDGISIISDSSRIGFAIGHYSHITSLEDAVFYIIAENIKYEDKTF